MVDDVTNLSAKYFDSGYYCAESVLLAISNAKSIQNELIPKISSGFCSGLSRSSGMCGAVAGGILAINLFLGRESPDDSVEPNYNAVKTFINMFEQKFSSCNCYELIDCDLNTAEGQEKFEKNNLIQQCQLFTSMGAKLAMSVIEEALANSNEVK